MDGWKNTDQYCALLLLKPTACSEAKADAIPDALPVTLPREVVGTKPVTLKVPQNVVSITAAVGAVPVVNQSALQKISEYAEREDQAQLTKVRVDPCD